MVERFSKEARRAVVLAQEEARALGHGYVGSEHLLLGLLEQGGIARAVLVSSGVTLDGVRSEVVRIVGSGNVTSARQIPFTAHAKMVLELALDDALRGSWKICTEHILLGLVRVEDGVASRVLRDCGVDYDGVRTQLSRLPHWRVTGPPGLRRAQMRRAIEGALEWLITAEAIAHDYYALRRRKRGEPASPVLANVAAGYQHLRQAIEALDDEPTRPSPG